MIPKEHMLTLRISDIWNALQVALGRSITKVHKCNFRVTHGLYESVFSFCFVFFNSRFNSICFSHSVIGYALISVIDCCVLWFSSALWAWAAEFSSRPSCLIASEQKDPLSKAQSASNSIFLGKLRQGWPCQDRRERLKKRERERVHSFSATPKGCILPAEKAKNGKFNVPHVYTHAHTHHLSCARQNAISSCAIRPLLGSRT